MSKSLRRLLLLLLVLLLSLLLGLCFGAASLSPAQLVACLMGKGSGAAGRIFLHVRLPRVLGAVLAGAALAVSGAILQAVLNNPMAAPNIIGVNSGAGFIVLLCAAFLPVSTQMMPVAAFLGALLSAGMVFLLSAAGGGSRTTLILVGVAMTSIMTAGMNCIMLLYPDAYIGASVFLVGGLSGVTLKGLALPSVMILAGLLGAMLLRREMNLLVLGDLSARSLGLNASAVRFLLVMLAALLAGAAVSFGGLIGFVGLIVPHALRLLLGNDNRWLIPGSALGGAALVVLCDLLARILFAPYELPVGILLSFLGGPFFIVLILRERRRRL